MDRAPVQPSFVSRALGAGVAACIADLCTFPLDTIKVRLQLQGEGATTTAGKTADPKSLLLRGSGDFNYRGVFGTIVTMAKQEGPLSLYNGLHAGLHRQMCFASVRIGMYDTVRQFYFDLIGGEKGGIIQGFLVRILAGCTTGCAAVLVAQPTDVVKVRMQAQGVPGTPKRYSGTFMAYRKIYVEEGRKGLWKGAVPNMARNAIVNTAEVVCYDLIKRALVNYNLMDDKMPCHFVSGLTAGFVTTIVASPVDVMKTRIMNSKPGQYSGMFDCGLKMVQERGLAAFYKGFIPNFYRMVSWNVVLWVTYEQLKIVAHKVENGHHLRPH